MFALLLFLQVTLLDESSFICKDLHRELLQLGVPLYLLPPPAPITLPVTYTPLFESTCMLFAYTASLVLLLPV